MLGYIGRRLAQTILVLFGVSILTFGMLFVSGDPTSLYVDPDSTPEEIAQTRHRMGFDRPLYVQYLDWVSDLFHGDLGMSYRQNLPVFRLVVERLPATIELTAVAMLMSVILAIPVGIVSATRRGSIWDNLGMVFAFLGQSVPNFWLGIVLMLAFGVWLRWLPVCGRGGLTHLILPAVTLSTYPLARNTRLVRSSMLEVMGEEYITTARSKGLSERVVVYRHALKNALIPVVTVVGLQAGRLLGGSVIVETVFAWPGAGRLAIQAIYAKDIPLVQGFVMIIASSFVFFNLVVDIIYTYLDPRIRYT